MNELRDYLMLPKIENDFYHYNQATVHLYTDDINRNNIMNRTVVMNTLTSEKNNEVTN